MSGGNFRLSTTERVIKGAWRAGPSSETRWERALGLAAVRGRREGAAAGEREGGGGGPGALSGGGRGAGVRAECGIPSRLPAGASGVFGCT